MEFLKVKAKAWEINDDYYDLTLSGMTIEINQKIITKPSISLCGHHEVFSLEIISQELQKFIAREVDVTVHSEEIKSVASDWVFEKESTNDYVGNQSIIFEHWTNTVTDEKIILDRKRKLYIIDESRVSDTRDGMKTCNFMDELIRTSK